MKVMLPDLICGHLVMRHGGRGQIAKEVGAFGPLRAPAAFNVRKYMAPTNQHQAPIPRATLLCEHGQEGSIYSVNHDKFSGSRAWKEKDRKKKRKA